MFPKQGFLQPGLQDDGYVMLVITSPQKITFPRGVTSIELQLQGGGATSSGGAVGNITAVYAGSGGACGISIIPVDPSVEYTVSPGAASIAPNGASTSSGVAGNASTFSGRNIATITAQGGMPGDSAVQAVAINAQLSIPGQMSINFGNQNTYIGGGTIFGGAGRVASSTFTTSTAYGSGAAPPSAAANSGLAGTNGNPGVAVIRYRGQP